MKKKLFKIGPGRKRGGPAGPEGPVPARSRGKYDFGRPGPARTREKRRNCRPGPARTRQKIVLCRPLV